jgi:hypothetical protein
MRWRDSLATIGLTSALVAVSLYPAVGQKSPQSILPPGFGEPDTPPAKAPPPKGSPPPDRPQRPDRPTPSPSPSPSSTPSRTPAEDVPEIPLVVPTTDTPSGARSGGGSGGGFGGGGDTVDSVLGNTAVAIPEPVEALPEIQRSVDGVGLLASGNGGLSDSAWGDADGRFLNGVMMRMRAPIASRWMSITLRRALLSQTMTPVQIGGADWVATRAWLLVRMGEADNARALVEGVDNGNFTPWLNVVAMQAALATADPAALCGIADSAARTNQEPSWLLARAMCAGLSGEGGTASALVDQARQTKKARGIDVLLAEKVMAVGANTRRAVTVQWDGVAKLNAWRFGLATATGVAIPERLLATAGPQVRAWQARAPLLAPDVRLASADRAATLGVFSNAALVDLYSQVYDQTDGNDRGGTVGAALRTAYVAKDAAARADALKALFASGGDNDLQHYARLILGARAAAAVAPASDAAIADDAVAAMLSTGLDIQAARWASTVTSGTMAWGLLAVSTPKPAFAISSSDVSSFRSTAGSDHSLRAQFLFAGLAGLGRLPAGDLESMAQDYDVPIGRVSSWTRALDQAVIKGQAGTVVLLCGAGMQAIDWQDVPPMHLYKIVGALRSVGLEPEARMIAAEALMRS